MTCFVPRVLCIVIGGGEGTVTWGMFPWGCEDTVARRRLLCKGEGGLPSFELTISREHIWTHGGGDDHEICWAKGLRGMAPTGAAANHHTMGGAGYRSPVMVADLRSF